MSTFPQLEQTILKAKGLTEENLAVLNQSGVLAKADFKTIGNLETLLDIMPSLDRAVAARVMDWAVGPASPPSVEKPAGANKVVIDSPDTTYCVHCNARQPKDYSTGDLCPACGKQAESVLSCYWCGQSGPGKFCRGCGAEFVSLAEFALAVLLKREGVAKDEIAARLKTMPPSEKEILWGRVQRVRG